MEQTDTVSEVAVLSAAINHGSDCYIDLSTVVNIDCFSDEHYAAIWKCLSEIYKGETKKADVPTILTTAKEIGLEVFFNTDEKQKVLKRVASFAMEADNALRFGRKLRKLQITRTLSRSLEIAQKELLTVTGNENTSLIIAKAEKPIFDTINEISRDNDGDGAVHISTGLRDLIQHIEDNPGTLDGIPSGFPEWDDVIGGGLAPGVHVIAARAKGGKAQPLYSKIYTKNGYKIMGDIIVGDEVWTPNGNLSKVIAIHPQGKKSIYRIYFKYGDYVDCCEDHLWKIYNYRKKKYQVLSLKEVLNSGKIIEKKRTKWFTPILECGPNYSEVELPIKPYLFGALLGDGYLKQGTIRFTNEDKEVINKIKKEIPDTTKLVRKKNKDIEYGIVNRISNHKRTETKIHLDKFGLSVGSHNKFIPEVYKYSSLEQRLEVIRGLMDTDGSVNLHDNNSSGIEFTTVSTKLAEDFKWLIQSIGGLVDIKKRYTSYTGTDKKFPSFRIRIFIDDPSILFHCSKKKNLCRKRRKLSLKRSIKNIEYIGEDEAKCITIADPDGLYLTDNFIVTHNSHICDNMGINIARNGIPVLVIDTEMQIKKHHYRLLSLISEVKVNSIKKGEYTKKQVEVQKIRNAEKELNELPYTYIKACSMSMEERLSHMRRWLMRTVGYGSNGKTNPCVIFYDQLKVTDQKDISGSLKEYQVLGFHMDELNNFGINYDIPIVALCQLNRDGINNESSAAVAGSDRIVQHCTSLTFLKWKSSEEIAKDGPELGTKKMVVVASRDGEGHSENGESYIHVGTQLSRAKMWELGSTTRPKKMKADFDIEAVQEILF